MRGTGGLTMAEYIDREAFKKSVYEKTEGSKNDVRRDVAES